MMWYDIILYYIISYYIIYIIIHTSSPLFGHEPTIQISAVKWHGQLCARGLERRASLQGSCLGQTHWHRCLAAGKRSGDGLKPPGWEWLRMETFRMCFYDLRRLFVCLFVCLFFKYQFVRKLMNYIHQSVKHD